ncbi:hypothetical protein V6N12_012679 [Hibiscus sabdariffa]|uniref:Uncharacterized protein n=1 Tax=Hibiscus sabdariffa TaxID=183260 RepID=A0ABR2DDB3_9ROSI
MLRLYLCKGFNNLLEQDDKGDVSGETMGPAPVEVSAGIQISAERDYSDPIAGLIEFPFLPRPRISADVFSAQFWVFSFGAASVQLFSLRASRHLSASFQTDKDDSRSQSGFVFRLNGGAVSWKSSKQDTVANSTTEAEYIAASEAAKEAVWIKKFITELGVVPSISDALELYCDNNGAIAQAKEPRSHQRSKHILWRFHLIREIVDRGDVEICKVHTDDNIADPLTKPLSQQKHDRHTESLGIRYVSDWS